VRIPIRSSTIAFMTGEQRPELKLSFDQLALIQRSLLAAKSLGILSQEDELVDDTIQLVDQALDAAS
jgi:hypothetical protein